MLDSWNDTKSKKTITDFVQRLTTKGSKDFVAEAERIAVFDNDGTLWTEQPTVMEGFFAFERISEMVAKDPSMKEKQPYKAFLEHDLKTIHALGKKGIVEFVFKSHESATQEEFARVAAGWFAKA